MQPGGVQELDAAQVASRSGRGVNPPSEFALELTDGGEVKLAFGCDRHGVTLGLDGDLERHRDGACGS